MPGPRGGLPSPCAPHPVTSEPRPHVAAVRVSLVLHAEGISASSVKELHEHETKGGALAGAGWGGCPAEMCAFPAGDALGPGRCPGSGSCGQCKGTVPGAGGPGRPQCCPALGGSALPDAVLWTPRARLPKERPVGAPGDSAHGPGASTYSLPGTK